MLVDENDDLVIITQEGMIIRQKVSDISIFERNTQGVHLINLRENDKVVDITIIPKEPDEEELDREVEKAKNAPSMQASNTMEDVTEEQDEEEEFRDEELPEEE
jgi:DNA gyrase subunit A